MIVREFCILLDHIKALASIGASAKEPMQLSVYNSLTDNAMELAISSLTVAGLASASRTS